MSKYLVLLCLPCIALAVFDTDTLDVNHWRVLVHNDGRIALDYLQMNFPGGCWPFPLENYYIFGAGLWVGSARNNETLVTIGYDPNSGLTEFAPALCRYWRQGYNDSSDCVFKHPGCWPPPSSRFPMAPQNWRSDQDLWGCFGDSDPRRHVSPETIPLGIDIGMTVYGFADSAASDFFFLKYNLMNYNDYSIDRVLIGMTMDADVGGNVTDDLNGLILNRLFHVNGDTIRVRNTGFTYDYDNIEEPGYKWQSGTPGMVAVALLAAPGDIGLCACKRFTIDIDPPTDPTKYLTMAGYNYRTGEYAPFDSIDDTPADKRFIECSGPVDIPAHDSAVFWYAIIGSPFGDSGEVGPKHDTSELAIRYREALLRLQQILAVNEPQPPRPLTISVQTTAFSPHAPLRVMLNGDHSGSIAAWDMNGRLVRQLTGKTELVWDGTADNGRTLPAGVYFLRRLDTESPPLKVVLSR
jgi:hypothetical protein